MSELEATNTELEATIETQERRITFLNKEIERDEKELSAANLVKKQLTEELGSHQRNEARLQTELSNTKTSLEAANEQMTSLERMLRETQNELEKTKKEALSLEQQLTKVKAEKNYVSDHVKELQTKLKDKLASIETLQTERGRAEQEIAALREEVDKNMDQVGFLGRELKESETNIKGLEQRIQQQVLQLSNMHRMETEFNSAKLVNKELEQKNQSLIGELETVKKQAEDNRALYNETMLEKGEADKTLKLEQLFYEKNVSAFKKTIQNQQELIQTHLSSIAAREEEIRNLQLQLRSLDVEWATAKTEGNKEEIEKLRLDVEVKEQKISTLQEQQRVSQTEIDTLREQVDQLKQKLAGSERESKLQAATINNQISIITKAETEIMKLQKQQDEIINSVKANLLELRGGVQMTGKRMDDCSGRLQRCEKYIQELLRMVEPMNIPNLAPLLNDIKSDLKGLGREFTTIRTEQGQNADRLASLESRTELLESSKTSVTIKSEQKQPVSVESDSSSLGETRMSGSGDVSQDDLQRGLATDLGLGGAANMGQDRLSKAAVDSGHASIQLQSQLAGDETIVSPRPTHLKDDSSLRGGPAPFGRYGDGFSSSEDNYLRGTASPDIQELLNESFDSASLSGSIYHSMSSTRDMDTMDSLTKPLSGDRRSNSDESDL
ncbi:hypothetical protein [Endozoicomonas sp. YOMI1]|uniref:hypothetical protein n=1 Tax=Endozoicomonas sp. YOMI1 TaxID=2828739 RepID=UPI0021491146|nr:hypothetical protein [Endozoicomonas sp. YOMI1]